MLLTESQWQLALIGFAGSLFQIFALYGISKYRKTQFPAAKFVAIYLPITLFSWIFYYKVFNSQN
jgi:hypothetical protein